MRFITCFVILFFCSSIYAFAQEKSSLDSALHRFTAEKDPKKSISMMNAIIKEYRLDPKKDAETLDVLYGTAAVQSAVRGDYNQFEKYTGSIRNKFNRTSFMNMAASKILNENGDAVFANKISKRTLDLYQAIKKDTTARPKDFSKKDWDRFMNFAQYPYYDTYAQSLFTLKKYREALPYQKMAFMGNPEDGLPSSVERYTKLLALTGKEEEAKQLLLKMARKGKINKGMMAQLHTLYVSEKGSDENLGAYLDSLQRNVQAVLVEELKPKMGLEIAPPFSLNDINGKVVSLSDFAGRIVVLDLWATWCVPCIASFPAMQTMVAKHPEVTFLFIAVEEKGRDPLSDVKKFIQKRGYPFTVLMDEPIEPNASGFKIITAYHPNGIPAKYIIDGKGMLRFKSSGFTTDAELMNELEAMFAILKNL